MEYITLIKEDFDRELKKVFKYERKSKEEIERLHSIIKEVRELVENGFFTYTIIKDGKIINISKKDILEILDKENNDERR